MSLSQVYLNGHYLPLAEAKVSVLDRGFLFGDGVYEVIPVYAGQPFRLDAHIQRLQASLAGIRLALPYGIEQWRTIFAPLLDAGNDQYLYLQITRGCAEKRDHAFPKTIEPTVLVMCVEMQPYAGRTHGIKVVSMDDMRWQFCNIKAITLLPNLLCRQTAAEQGCAEALLIRDGVVSEGAASNVFAVIDGSLQTPLKDQRILAGITRDVVLELAGSHGIAYRETDIRLNDLYRASEIWVTSSIREIVPVIEIDGNRVGDGLPGPVFQQLDALFQTCKRS